MVPKLFVMLFLVFSAIPQLLICHGEDQQCEDPWLGSTDGLIDNCDLLKNKFEVNLVNLECVRAIGYKVKNKTDWDKIIEVVDPTKVVAFETTEAFCQPLNLTLGVRFWNGTTHENRKVKVKLNPMACSQKDLTLSEIQSLKRRCPKGGLKLLSPRENKMIQSKSEETATSQDEKVIFGPWRDTEVCSESCGNLGHLLQTRSCSAPHPQLTCASLNSSQVLRTGSTPCNRQLCQGMSIHIPFIF